jgi:hypothetical protein
MRRGFAACFLGLVVLAGVAITRPASAFEAWDGRLQVHGFGETIARTISSNYTDDWDLTQWQFLLNVEIELDIAPDGWGPFTAISAYSRLEVRYDCVWRRACSLFENANVYGDRAVRGPNWLTDGEDIGTVYRGTAFANGNSPPEGGRISPRGDYVPLGEHPVFSLVNDAAGVDQIFGTKDDPGPLILQGYGDYTLTSRRVRGSTNGEGRQDYGPWRPKEFISPIGVLADRGNCLSPIEKCVVTGNTFPGRDKPFRPYPVRSAKGPYSLPTGDFGLAQPPNQARGMYLPSKGLIDFLNDEDTTFTSFDQNFTQTDLEWNIGGSQSDERELRELYLDMEFFDGRLFVRLGKQTIVWGKTELFRTTDQFNPQDVGLSTLPSLEESRIPLWAIRAIYSFYDVGPLEDVRFELAANIDQFEPIDIGRCGEPYAPIPACQKAFGLFVHGFTGLGIAGEVRPPAPWEDIRHTEFGARLEWRWKRFSFALTDFFGYNDTPTIDPLYTYTRSVDPRTGRPRFGFSEGGCDPENLFDGDTTACLGTQRSDLLPAQFQGRVPPVQYSGAPLLSPMVPQPGRITASRNSNLKGSVFNDIREQHSVNQQLYQFICAGTVGFSDLFPGLENECSFSVFGSGVPVTLGPVVLPVAEAVGQVFGGSNNLVALLGSAANGIPLVQDLNPALNPGACCLFPLLPLNTLDRRTGEGMADSVTTSGLQLLPLGNISAAFTPEQQALLGCGAYYGTTCDLDGTDLMNAEASALLQAFPAFDGTPLFGFDTRYGPQPATVGFPGGQPCGRYERGHFFILPGCRGPGDPGYDPAVDGEPFFNSRVRTGLAQPVDPTAAPGFTNSDITLFNSSMATLASVAGTAPCSPAAVGDRFFQPLTCAPFHSEMAALSWNFLMLAIIFSQNTDANLSDAENFDVYDPKQPFAKGRCSFAQPHFCSVVRALFTATGVGRQDLRAAGNRRFGRRDFLWHTGREFVVRYDRRNILGLSLDFAEDVSKTNWSMEATWFSDVSFADRNAVNNNTTSDVYNLTISVDRPTFVNFLNANRTLFFNSQWFFQYVPQHTDAFSGNGPVNVLGTFTVLSGFYQDRLLTATTLVYDFQSNSGAVLPSFTYRFTEAFSAQIGLAFFFGGFDIRPPFLNPTSAQTRVGKSAYSDFVENGLSIVRHRDELFMRIRYTF